MAITAGLYEIRSMLLTSMCADVAGGSSVKGANIQLYGSNGSNAQKYWLVEETTGHWSIQNAASLLYMDVAGGSATQNANVQQWTDNDSNAQRWNIIDSGTTTTIDGATCPVVTIGSYADGTGTAYVVDISNAMTTARTNIQIHTANGSTAQQFALLPTTLLDAGMPAPSLMGWATSLTDIPLAVQVAQATLYPVWAFTDAWSSLTDHGFEVQCRSRKMANDSASYGDWSAYTAWASASVTVDGHTARLTGGITGNFDTSTYKAMEYDFRVRATGTIGGSAYHSQAASMTLRSVNLPTLGITGATRVAGTTPALRLAVTSTYTGGTTMVRVTGVRQLVSGTTYGPNLLAKPLVAYGKGASFGVDVPLSSFSALPLLGTLRIDYELGTDQYLAASYVGSASGVTYSDAASKTITVAGALTWGTDALAYLVLTITSSGGTLTTTVYLDAGGEVLEIAPDASGKYPLPYSFGSACTWYAFVGSTNNTWGVASGTIAANDSHKVRPCHAWNWDGGMLMLEVDEQPLQTSRTLKADYTDYQLSGRQWHALKFGGSADGGYSAEGVLVDGLTVSNKAALTALLHEHHATYRAPSGEVAHVGVTEIQYTSDAKVTRVTVTMAQVSR